MKVITDTLDISRSNQYDGKKGRGRFGIKKKDDDYLRLIKEITDSRPTFGYRRVTAVINRILVEKQQKRINHKRIYRIMGTNHLLLQKHTGRPVRAHTGDIITLASNMRWCSYITYIPMVKGFCYLVAVMDWASRKVLSWRLSNTLDNLFCIDALEEAIARYGTPDIFNADQGSQFTSEKFTDILKDNGIKISMDGRGRWMDNIFIERLWRTVKYEDIYLRAYSALPDLRQGIKAFFERYNSRRCHQGLGDRTPDEVYITTLPERRKAV